MAVKIRILIVDDMEATRENIRKLLGFHPETEVVGMADSGEGAIVLVRELKPDIVLMDINMPGMDGITATEKITAGFPGISVIIMSVQGEQEYLRRSQMAGAKGYLVKPFSGDELLQMVIKAFGHEQQNQVASPELPVEQGKVVSLFSPKGGTGKTMLAVNLALALALKTGERVGIVDADLQFGDLALFLPVAPRGDVEGLVKDIDHLDEAVLMRNLTSYHERVWILAAPSRPEKAAMVNNRHLQKLLRAMRHQFKYVIVDTESAFNDNMISILDGSDEILLVSGMSVPALKNMKLCIESLGSFGYPRNKLRLVFNRCPETRAMAMRASWQDLLLDFAANLPQEDELVFRSIDQRLPLVEFSPESKVAQGIFSLAEWLLDRLRRDRG